jgi:hypothetical protein
MLASEGLRVEGAEGNGRKPPIAEARPPSTELTPMTDAVEKVD